MSDIRNTPLVFRREAVHVRRDDRQSLRISVMLEGSAFFDRNRKQEKLSVGEIVMYGTWHPWDACALAPIGRALNSLAVQVPRHAIPFAPSRVDQLLGRPLPTQGTGAILVQFLKDLLVTPDPGTQRRPQEAEQLGNAALALSTAMIAGLVDAETSLPPEVRRTELLARIHAFIGRHLGDPNLSPATLAAAHHISLRQLHRIFHEEDTSVSATVRQRRLERCRRDLAAGIDPVHEIAARWGFTDAAHFSRAFRSTYGHSPLDYRHLQT